MSCCLQKRKYSLLETNIISVLKRVKICRIISNANQNEIILHFIRSSAVDLSLSQIRSILKTIVVIFQLLISFIFIRVAHKHVRISLTTHPVLRGRKCFDDERFFRTLIQTKLKYFILYAVF